MDQEAKNIRLPAVALAELFGNNLVTGSSPRWSVPEESPKAELRYLGANARRVVIVLRSGSPGALSEKHLAFLEKMLQACKMHMGDVAVVNLNGQEEFASGINRQLQPSVVILFGVTPSEIRLPFDFPEFKVQPYDQCRYLLAPNLDLIDQETGEGKLLKSKLWLCLKAIFSI